MKSVLRASETPRSFPLAADMFTELHPSRLLLLLKNCGVSGRVEGLTKLAKLDFFVRYPDFFERIAQHLGANVESAVSSVESAMVRHRYGPWDKRYYHILPFLEARSLITIRKEAQAYIFELTDSGKKVASTFSKAPEFAAQVSQMKRVKSVLGAKSGSRIKRLIYEVFDEEIAKKALGYVIE
jgi:hypothetical protein